MDSRSKRFQRESLTLRRMTQIYCTDQHAKRVVPGDTLCQECAELLRYADYRLEKCVFGDGKPQCVKCPVHCYNSAMRETARKIMVYAGPKMLLNHPILATLHFFDGFRKPKWP